MSTHTAPLKAEPAPLPANAYCPTCGQVLPPLQIQEYPKVMYKAVAKPADKDKEEEQVETVVVNDSEEEKKKEGEGYSKDVPKPKDAGKKPDQHDDKPLLKHDDKPLLKHDDKPVEHEQHNKKS